MIPTYINKIFINIKCEYWFYKQVVSCACAWVIVVQKESWICIERNKKKMKSTITIIEPRNEKYFWTRSQAIPEQYKPFSGSIA